MLFYQYLFVCVDLIHCQRKSVIVSCLRSQRNWGSTGSMPETSKTEFPRLQISRFPLKKWRFTISEIYQIQLCVPPPPHPPRIWGPPLSHAAPRPPLHIARDSPDSRPVRLLLPYFIILPLCVCVTPSLLALMFTARLPSPSL